MRYLFLLLALMACDQKSMVSDIGSQRIVLQTTDDTNNSAPVAVDLVLTSHPQVAQHLGRMTAKSYFRHKSQLLRDYPGQVLIAGWEMVPNHRVEDAIQHAPGTSPMAFVFADYKNGETHRAAWPFKENVTIYLQRHGFVIRPE